MDELRVLNEVDTTQYIVIRLGEEQYGVDIKYIDSILRMQRIKKRKILQKKKLLCRKKSIKYF